MWPKGELRTYTNNYFLSVVSTERIRLQYTDVEEIEVNILNNTVINSFPIRPRSKREVGGFNGVLFSVDCFGAQGDHNPVWRTDNPLLGDENGAIAPDNGRGLSQLLSNYSARFQLVSVAPDVNGTYSCVSQRSGLLSQFFLTIGEHSK